MTDTQPKSPLNFFFSLGDKVTKGDPKRKLDFDYYMMWIIFLAFGFVSSGNIWRFLTQGYQVSYLGWSMFGGAIMWFQYFNLKNIWLIRKNYKPMASVKVEEDKIENVKDMLKGFKK